MISKSAHNRLLKQRGMTLLEMLLALGVAAVFFAFTINVGRTIAREQMIAAAAAYVDQLAQAIENSFANPARFNALYAQLQLAGGQGQATIDEFRDGTGFLDPLPPSPSLSQSFPDQGPGEQGQTYRLLFRIGDNIADPNDNPVIESIIASETLIQDELALRISGAISGTGGTLRAIDIDQATPTPTIVGSTIRGAFGGWSVPTNNLAATNWYATVRDAAQQPTSPNSLSYVVSYNYYDLSRIAKDYLYRTNTGDPNLNRLRGDLQMGGYNVVGVDNIVTPALTSDQVSVAGNATIGGNTAITGDVQSDGPARVVGAITGTGGNTSLSTTNGTLTASTIAATGPSVFSGDVTTGSLEAGANLVVQNDLVFSGTAVNVAGAAGINANAPNGVVVAGALNNAADANSEVSAAALETNDLTVAKGDAGMAYLDSARDYTITPGGTVTATTFVGNGQTRTNDTTWGCGSGC